MFFEIIKTIFAYPFLIVRFKIGEFILILIFIKSFPTKFTLIKIVYA